MIKTGKSLALFSEDELPPVSGSVSTAARSTGAVSATSANPPPAGAATAAHLAHVDVPGAVDVSATVDVTTAVNAPGAQEAVGATDEALPASARVVQPTLEALSATARVVQPTLEEQAAVQGATERAQLWLALTFFAFPLEVLCRDAQPEQATVVVDEQGGRPCVIACDQLAYHQGVRTGMKLAAAYALVHELDVRARDEQLEQATLERLATWAKKFTPLVSLCPPGALLLEVKGSLALFGGVAGLLESVQHDLRVLGFAEMLAVAPTPTAALWLAQQAPLKSEVSTYEQTQRGQVRRGHTQHRQAGHKKEKHRHSKGEATKQGSIKHAQGIALDEVALKAQLGKLPIAVTAWPERVLSRLQGMGVRTLRDCLRLPRDGFARRVGKQHLLELDQALGLAPDPRKNHQPPDKFVARRELLFALESVNMIVRGLDKLLVELCAFLRGRQSGVQGLRITLYHPHTKASVLNVGTASACRDHGRLASLVQEKIEQLTLPEGVVAISMVSGRLYPLTGFDGQLFNDSVHSDVRWPELVEKLRARLGAEAVTGLCLVPEHRPEQAWKYTEPGTSSDAAVNHRRPLWLLAHPYRLPNRDGQPYWHGPLSVLHGPERIESGWWDGEDAARDYFVVINSHQLTLWIYCERVSGADADVTLCENELFMFTDVVSTTMQESTADGGVDRAGNAGCGRLFGDLLGDGFESGGDGGVPASSSGACAGGFAGGVDDSVDNLSGHSAGCSLGHDSVHGLVDDSVYGLVDDSVHGSGNTSAGACASRLERTPIELPDDPALRWFVHGVFA